MINLLHKLLCYLGIHTIDNVVGKCQLFYQKGDVREIVLVKGITCVCKYCKRIYHILDK